MTDSNSTPESLYKNFLVDIDPKKISPALDELNTQIGAIDRRIYDLIEKFKINEMPIMGPLLQMVQNPDELTRFSKGLERAGVLLNAKKTLETKRSALSALKETPSWFMGTLNDFDDDIESIVATIDNVSGD